MTPWSFPPRRTLLAAMAWGFRGRCPHCRKGPIFWRYLKVWEACPACGHALGEYPSDDGPAYFTILIICQLVIAPLTLWPAIWKAPVALVIPATLIPIGVIGLVLLPRIKGAVIGLHYALRVARADAQRHTADEWEP